MRRIATSEPLWRRWGPLLVLTGLWAALHGGAIAGGIAPVLDGELIGTDAYMRLVRVEELWAGGGWFNSTILDSNAPFGETLHWTRPFDVLTIGGAALLDPFLSARDAIFWSGALLSPLLHLAVLIAFGWAVRPLLGRTGAIMAVGALLLQPGVVSASLAGRADHHSLQLLLLVLGIGWLIRAMRRPDPDAESNEASVAAVMAGVVAGAGLWVATESMVWVLVGALVLAFAWLREGERWLWLNLRFAGALTATVGIALVLERPSHDWLASEYDRLSIVHLGAAAALVLCWAGVWAATVRLSPGPAARWPGGPLGERGLVGAGAGVMGLGGLLAVFPGLIEGPFANLDPRLEAVFFNRVSELSSLLPTSGTGAADFLLYVGSALVVAPALGWLTWRRRRDPDWAGWLLVSLLLGAFLVLAVQHVRVAAFAEVLLAIGIAAVVLTGHRHWQRGSSEVLRAFGAIWLAALLLAGAPLGSLALRSAAGDGQSPRPGVEQPAGCDLHAVGSYLATEPPGVILTSIFYGPELIYRTEHRVVAGPYHRNDTGILAVYDAFTSGDDGPARALIAERDVRLVLLCPSDREDVTFLAPTGERALRERLLRGETPDWLQPLAVPDELGILLWEVV